MIDDHLPEDNKFPDFSTYITEDDLYQAIKDRVAYLLEYNPDLLMSYLYRLDVLEKDINKVLAADSMVPPLEGLSTLILKRQKERIETKKKYKSPPVEPGWEY